MFLRSLKSERHSAGTVLLDRAFGKPVQAVTGPDGEPVSLLHLFAVRETGLRVIEEIMQRQSSPIIEGQANGGVVASPPGSLSDLAEPATE
jgi:hypothetical protein